MRVCDKNVLPIELGTNKFYRKVSDGEITLIPIEADDWLQNTWSNPRLNR